MIEKNKQNQTGKQGLVIDESTKISIKDDAAIFMLETKLAIKLAALAVFGLVTCGPGGLVLCAIPALLVLGMAEEKYTELKNISAEANVDINKYMKEYSDHRDDIMAGVNSTPPELKSILQADSISHEMAVFPKDNNGITESTIDIHKDELQDLTTLASVGGGGGGGGW